ISWPIVFLKLSSTSARALGSVTAGRRWLSCRFGKRHHAHQMHQRTIRLPQTIAAAIPHSNEAAPIPSSLHMERTESPHPLCRSRFPQPDAPYRLVAVPNVADGLAGAPIRVIREWPNVLARNAIAVVRISADRLRGQTIRVVGVRSNVLSSHTIVIVGVIA